MHSLNPGSFCCFLPAWVRGFLLPLAIVVVQGAGLRPPAVPLVAHDPYFSIWSPADKLTDADTMHWTGKPHRLTSLVRIDDKAFRIMGVEPTNTPPLPQINLQVLPTRTTYTFEGQGVRLTLTFLTPALPDDLDVVSRPLTYLTWQLQSIDGTPHAVKLYFDVSPEVAVNDLTQEVRIDRIQPAGLDGLRAGSSDQPSLQKKGDDLRIDWGYLYAAAPSQPTTECAPIYGFLHRQGFAAKGVSLRGIVDWPEAPLVKVATLGFTFDLGEVGNTPISRWLMLAYDDEVSIKYFRGKLRPYWRRGGMDANALLAKAASEYESLRKRCATFDEQLMSDLRHAGGDRYAELCALAYRQTFAGNKIVADGSGKPLMFPKENFSNGCIGTVDVLFPQAPFFLTLSPALTKAMLVPILDYATSPGWPHPYAPHDLGTYPHATGQVYGMGGSDGERMPVEESGNMLIMLAALAKSEGDADFSKPYQPLLVKWADYLVKEGLDPTNQLCSADMFGHLPRNANLALKAIIGIGAYAQLCELSGNASDSRRYLNIARDYAAQWQDLARDEGRTRLAYGQTGTWSMKHNLIWDRVLGLKLFPHSLGDAEAAWYLKVQGKYGLPVDNRTDTSLIDWALWSIALASSDRDFQALLDPIFRYANETPTRVPLSDWFITTDAKRKGFQARPVVGGIFIKMLADASTWQRCARLGANVSGPWAPIPVMVDRAREVVPTALASPTKWRYTFEKPAGDWTQPGYDDSRWMEGYAGFGTKGTPGATINTEWNTKEIWLRREFSLPSRALKNPRLLLIYDENPDVFLNGTLAARFQGWITSYDEVDITGPALAALRAGKNVVAAHGRQTYGGQCLDLGIIEETGPLPARKLFDFPVRDTSVCVGPDGLYYLTGTTGESNGGSEDRQGWWYVNRGIRVWKSPDLLEWTPLGLVWTIEKDGTWQRPIKDGHRAIWAPEIHYLKGTFWLTYCVNWEGGGTGLLKSTTGKPEGPYTDVKPDGPMTSEIDASLFQDDDGKVYFVYQNGKIARLKNDLSGLAEEPRLLQPANAKQVGFEGAFLTKIGGRYQLVCAEFNQFRGAVTYDCMMASSTNIFGPYGDRYLAVPHGGHNMLFKDKSGGWWATFFGNDSSAPWREKAGILPVELDTEGHVHPVGP